MRQCDYIAGFVRACQDRGLVPGEVFKQAAVLKDPSGQTVGRASTGTSGPRPTTRGASATLSNGSRIILNTSTQKVEKDPIDQVTDNRAITPSSNSQVT